jgi:hypothetical protein
MSKYDPVGGGRVTGGVKAPAFPNEHALSEYQIHKPKLYNMNIPKFNYKNPKIENCTTYN